MFCILDSSSKVNIHILLPIKYIAAYINILNTIVPVQVTIVGEMSCLEGFTLSFIPPILLRSCWCFTDGPTQFAFETCFKILFGGLSKPNNARINVPLKLHLKGSLWEAVQPSTAQIIDLSFYSSNSKDYMSPYSST